MAEPITRLVRADNPGPLTGPGTNSWIFAAGEAVVIDPGPLEEGHLERLARAARDQGRVAMVILTHHHLDHSEGAARFCELVQAPLARQRRLSLGPTDLPVEDGDRLLVGDSSLVALHTPGHASDHLCLYSEETGQLFTGDHVLQGTTSMVAPPDGDMVAYLGSLRRLIELSPKQLHPGHGEIIAPAGPALQKLLEHRLERERQVLGALESGPSSPAELAAQLYRGYPEAVLGLATKTTLAHLLKLEAEGKVGRDRSSDQERFRLS